MNKIFFEYCSKEYECQYEKITLQHSLDIDFKSYKNNEFNSINEMDKIFSELSFKILYQNNIIFDSEKNNYSTLNFNIVKKIYTEIKKELNLSPEEVIKFLTSCNNFFDSENKTGALPKELLIAKKIYRKEIQLSYTEMMNMNTKEYEKIFLAVNMIQEAVGRNNAENYNYGTS